jgi:serine/threonine protein kinase/uncharacterized protein HemY
MTEPTAAGDTSDELLANLADDILRRHRAGEKPTPDEYCERHRELAGRIRDLFPAILAMEQPGTGSTVDLAPPAERVGATVGRYKLLERIGEGGFGAVYMAEQQHPVRRKVALKVIKPGLDTRQVIARFEAERQALALMDHENIAKVLDAGATDSGRPYFVMELVHGVPITEYCDRNQLPPRERLELFVQVCRAVQHAHTKGIIHRDLKPTNVLVTLHEGVAVPKVIDFGVAKATGQQLTEKTLFTNFQQMVGTPLYMSPEQAEMTGVDVDTRSDVYSLGVLLYELLTGTTPVDKERLNQAAFDEVRRIIREEEPPRPSTRLGTMAQEARSVVASRRKSDPLQLGRQMRRELDWIVMKALEKQRGRRYETPSGLAQDVGHYLRDEPVGACPPSSAYRLRKLLRRHKVSMTTAILVAASLVLGTAVSVWQAAVARHAQAQAAARLVAETQARQQASAISQLLQEGLASANPDTARGSDYTVRQLLDQISARLGDQLRDQPAAEAAIRATIGNAYFRLGLPEQAAPHLKRALELREQLFGPDHADVARSLYDEAWNLQEYGDVEGAEARVRRALGIHRKLGLRSTETVRLTWLLQLILRREGREAESEEVGRGAQAMARQLPDASPDLANVLHTLAESARLLRRDLGEGERLARESVALHRRFHGSDHPQTARALSLLGILLADEKRYDEAEPCFRESLAVFAKHFDYINEGALPAVAGLAVVCKARGDTAGLEALRADVAARARSVLRRRANDAAPLLYAALALATVGDTDAAVELYSAAAAADGGRLKVWYKRIDQLAWLLAVRPDPEQRHTAPALDLAQQAVALAPRDGAVWTTLGAAHYRAGHYQAALESLTRSVELQPSDETAAFLFLAMTHWHLGNRDEARRWYDRAAERIDKGEPGSQRLTLLRREVAEVLGMSQQTKNRPACVDHLGGTTAWALEGTFCHA